MLRRFLEGEWWIAWVLKTMCIRVYIICILFDYISQKHAARIYGDERIDLSSQVDLFKYQEDRIIKEDMDVLLRCWWFY